MTDGPVLLAVVSSTLALIGLGLLAAGWTSLRRRRWGLGVLSSLSGLSLLLIGLIGWGVVLGTRGYRALTREERAATVHVRPLGPQSFRAVVETPDAAADTFRIAGDQLYVDARVLKWHPWANLLGIHTAYRLARIGGRYRSLEQERTAERTVYALSDPDAVDLFRIVARIPALAPAVDATYGSAAFAAAGERETYDVRITTSGLLIRSRSDTVADGGS